MGTDPVFRLYLKFENEPQLASVSESIVGSLVPITGGG